MSIRHIMIKKVVTVELDDTLETIKNIFDTLKFHHVLVVENNKLVGIISDRDVLKAISPNLGTMGETLKDLATLNKRAHQIMSHNPIVLRPDSRIMDAISMFNKHHISCIPIVDGAFKAIGIISWRDIFRILLANKDNINLDGDIMVE